MSGPELLEAVGNAERERAAAPDEVPLGEWEAVRVRPDCNAPLISQALLTNAEEAKSLLQVGQLLPDPFHSTCTFPALIADLWIDCCLIHVCLTDVVEAVDAQPFQHGRCSQ